MMTIELLPLSEILAEIIEMLVGCFIGWLIIGRIRLFVKCVKTKRQWKQQQRRQ